MTGGKTLALLLAEAQKERGLSDRAMAQEIGVAYTTIARVMVGQTPDVTTILKVSEWLGVEAASLLNGEGFTQDTLAAQIAAVLETEPKLAQVFGEAMQRVLDGQMEPSTFRDLAAYAAYRLNLEKEEGNDITSKPKE